MKLIVLDGHMGNPGDLSWEPVSQLVDELVCYDRTAPEETVARIGDAEAVFSNKVPITRQVLEACPKLKYVGVLATGYNQVDLPAARERGVAVTNIPGYSTDSVAQFTFALLLELCHRVGHHHQALEQGRGSTSLDFCFWDSPQQELAGKTLGLVGYGAIGQRVGEIGRAFGMKILSYTRHPEKKPQEGVRFVTLEELLGESDVISLHCPLTAENENLICRETLAKCRPGAVLLNTARGGLVEENDLREALSAGRLAAAAVDVVKREPATPESCPLLGLENCIVTPHIAWASRAARRRLMALAAENLRAWLAGERLNRVETEKN